MNAKGFIHRSFLHGLAKLFVLHRAGQEPVYGEALGKSLRSFGYHISPGSLYPLLHALEREKLLRCRISVTRGRVRKYYELTTKGQSCLAAVREELAGLVHEVIFNGEPHAEDH
ncbi:MAG: PadR family transcriptional regulator [Candidatus Binatia bacterium]